MMSAVFATSNPSVLKLANFESSDAFKDSVELAKDSLRAAVLANGSVKVNILFRIADKLLAA